MLMVKTRDQPFHQCSSRSIRENTQNEITPHKKICSHCMIFIGFWRRWQIMTRSHPHPHQLSLCSQPPFRPRLSPPLWWPWWPLEKTKTTCQPRGHLIIFLKIWLSWYVSYVILNEIFSDEKLLTLFWAVNGKGEKKLVLEFIYLLPWKLSWLIFLLCFHLSLSNLSSSSFHIPKHTALCLSNLSSPFHLFHSIPHHLLSTSTTTHIFLPFPRSPPITSHLSSSPSSSLLYSAISSSSRVFRSSSMS